MYLPWECFLHSYVNSCGRYIVVHISARNRTTVNEGAIYESTYFMEKRKHNVYVVLYYMKA